MTISKRMAFTLVELLVVIAIIVLLLALLMPGLKAARECAYSAVCHSNQRQLGAGVAVYSADWSAWIPGPGNDSPNAWYRVIESNGGANLRRVISCMETQPTSSPSNILQQQLYSRTLGESKLADTLYDPRKLAWFVSPSSTCLLMCSQKGSSIGAITRYAYWSQEVPKYPYATPNHGNGRNVLYLDGRSAYMERTFPPTTSNSLFWLGY